MNPQAPEIAHFQLNSNTQYALLDLVKFAALFGLTDKRVIEKQASLFAVRAILGNDTEEIHYHESGKPWLGSGGGISISHSYDLLAVMLSATETDIGIDIEKVRDKIVKIKHKFLSAEELRRIENASLNELTIYWAAKESVYKACGINGLLFAEQIFVEAFTYAQQGGKITVQVNTTNSQKKYTLRYTNLNDYVLVYTDAA